MAGHAVAGEGEVFVARKDVRGRRLRPGVRRRNAQQKRGERSAQRGRHLVGSLPQAQGNT
jgi:hypothetical protein